MRTTIWLKVNPSRAAPARGRTHPDARDGSDQRPLPGWACALAIGGTFVAPVVLELRRPQDRPRWHYVDVIFVPEGQRVERPDPPRERCVPGAEPDNVLQAIKRCGVQLDGKRVSDAEKAA